ncbi:MAG: tail fiber protein [Rhodospirillales bacterium]|nr:tail fiber protein [Rhodospirillales bacterium]
MLLGQPARSQAPAGSIMDFAGTTLPAGWLECDGSAVSRTTYAALFAALGTTWGAGDGSTTFNLPNLNGRVTAGRNGSGVGLTATTISATQGAAAFTIAAANLPPHAHNFNVNSGTESAPHTHNVSDPGHVHVTGTAGTANPGGAALAATGYGPNTSAMSAATTGISLSTETASHYHNVAGATDNGPGASSPLSIVQPTAIVMKIIKT